MNKSVMKTLNVIAQTIYDKKGFNILALDVRGISTLADYIIISEGNIDRHIKALSSAIQDSLLKAGQSPIYVEGAQVGDWIILDYGEIAVHLLIPEFREKYALEELWQKAKIIDLTIIVDKQEQQTK